MNTNEIANVNWVIGKLIFFLLSDEYWEMVCAINQTTIANQVEKITLCNGMSVTFDYYVRISSIEIANGDAKGKQIHHCYCLEWISLSSCRLDIHSSWQKHDNYECSVKICDASRRANLMQSRCSKQTWFGRLKTKVSLTRIKSFIQPKCLLAEYARRITNCS